MGDFSNYLKRALVGELPAAPSVSAPNSSDLPRSYVNAHRLAGVSVDQALGIGAAYRCVHLLTTIGSSLDIDAMRVGRPLLNQPALLRKPNLGESRRTTIAKTIAAMATNGECFWITQRTDPVETPAQIKVVPTTHINIFYDEWTDTCTYELRTPDGRYRPLQFWEIRHLKLLPLAGYPRGLGPIQAARSAFQGALDLEDYAGEWFNKTELPEGVLTTGDELSRDQAKRYQEMWMQARQEGRTAVMGKGLVYKPIMINPVDAQFIENRKLSVVEVSRMFGVPATLLDAPSGDSATYSNQRDKYQMLLDLGLRRYLDEIEDAFSELLPLGTMARFQTDELLRLNAKEQVEVDAVQVKIGLRTINELRIRDGMPEIDEPKSAPALEASVEEKTNA